MVLSHKHKILIAGNPSINNHMRHAILVSRYKVTWFQHSHNAEANGKVGTAGF
jgi:hypothetical protein